MAKRVILVSQERIRHNEENSEKKPPILITDPECRDVAQYVYGLDLNGPVKLHYNKEKLKNQARVWLECDSEDILETVDHFES